MGSAKDLGESYTVSFWMKPGNIGKDVDPTFCAGTFSPEYWLSATFDAKLWSKNGDYIATNSSNAYRSGEWQYVSIVVDASKAGSQDGRVTGSLYVNGQMVSSGDVAKGIMTNNGAKLYFGVNAWDAYYKGALDDLIMLNTALGKREINAFMDGTIGTDGKVQEPEPDDREEIAAAKATLREKITKAEAYQASDYTPDTFGVLETAIEDGKKVLTDEAATLDEVLAAITVLDEAEEGLEKAETPEPEPEPFARSEYAFGYDRAECGVGPCIPEYGLYG